MHVENLTINVASPSPLVAALLASVLKQPKAADAEATSTPQIGQPWPGQGGIYAGIAGGLNGAPDHHLILATEAPKDKLNWKAARAWATGVEVDGHKDFELPTRFESALLYAHLRDQFDTSGWYWTETQDSDSGCAWFQYFYDGSQSHVSKGHEGRARAVRRFTA